jgi:hypothetical protein
MTNQTFFTIKTPDGKLLPDSIRRSKQIATDSFSTNWEVWEAEGWTVVPVRVSLEEIQP